MKKQLAVILIIFIIFVPLIPAVVFLTGYSLPAQFDETYYGELADMYDRLVTSEKKKIVVVGTSSVAFGVECAVAEGELAASGLEDYEVCKFGLYGALGTKLMMELSRDHISEGDIVIFMPEFTDQTMSLYFSASDTWRSFDGCFDLFWELEAEDMECMGGR